jgi:superfamily II DNA or RNA helicase
MNDLRKYQRECLNACIGCVREGGAATNVCILPQGSGKSHIIGSLANEIDDVLVVTPRVELASQIKKKTGKPCVCTINLAYVRGYCDYSLLIIDECHLLGRSSDGMYKTLMSRSPKCVVIGFTATPFRGDEGHLVPGIFSEILYEIGRKELIEAKYLIARKFIKIDHELLINLRSLNNVSIRKISKATMPQTEACVNDFLSKKGESDKSIIFGCDIAHCKKIKKLIVGSELIHSKISRAVNAETLKKFRSGETKTLINCEMLTMGFDCPDIDNVVLLRPTDSYSLYEQMIGRGDRPFEGKTVNTIYDYTLNSFNFSHKKIKDVRKEDNFYQYCVYCNTLTDYRLKCCEQCGKGLVRSESIKKKCIFCKEYNSSLARYCKFCGNFIKGKIEVLTPYMFSCMVLNNGKYAVRFMISNGYARSFTVSKSIVDIILETCKPMRIRGHIHSEFLNSLTLYYKKNVDKRNSYVILKIE